VTPEIAARLEAMGIQLVAEAKGYTIFVREECIALAQSDDSSFTSLGSSGMMTEKGLAYLVWRNGNPLLVAKEGEVPAEAGQVERIRKFSGDLKSALGLG
jgi:hypothetical protein